MSHPPILTDTFSVISSQASVDGRLPCDSQAGQPTGRYGQEAAPANLSARQAKALGLLTSGTCGPASTGSSGSAALQSSLASRLQARLSDLGSTLYSLTWKPWVTPAGRMLARQRALARNTSDSAPTGQRLPTPSGTSNHGKNHVAGRLDEWGGSSNPFRGTSLGRIHCPAFELLVMGYPETWAQLMPPATPSSRSKRPSSSRR